MLFSATIKSVENTKYLPPTLLIQLKVNKHCLYCTEYESEWNGDSAMAVCLSITAGKNAKCCYLICRNKKENFRLAQWVPGHGFPCPGRDIHLGAGISLPRQGCSFFLKKKNTPARAQAFFLREEYPCPGMGVLLDGRIPLPGQGYPCPGRGVHILFLALNIKVVQCN